MPDTPITTITQAITPEATARAPRRWWLSRPVACAQVLLRHAGLGSLVRHRVLTLEHTVGRTGRRRRSVLEVLEVLEHDTDSAIVMPRCRTRSDWLVDLQAEPSCVVNLGRSRRLATAHVVGRQEGTMVLERFRMTHRGVFRAICRSWGLDPGDPGTTGRLAELAPVMTLRLGDVAPLELLCRRFEVDVPLEQAWDALADVASWPSWARHLRSVDVDPPGAVTDSTAGRFRLAGGIRTRFEMRRFEPRRRWEWTGRLATLTVHYDHRFDAVAPERTALTWTIGTTGLGRGTLGLCFASVYARRLDRAIPRLQSQMRAACAMTSISVGATDGTSPTP